MGFSLKTETLLADVEDLAELKWEHIVVDEGHRLKNRSSKLVSM